MTRRASELPTTLPAEEDTEELVLAQDAERNETAYDQRQLARDFDRHLENISEAAEQRKAADQSAELDDAAGSGKPAGDHMRQAAEAIAAELSAAVGERIAPHEVLVDAPPAELEVDFDIEVFFSKQNVYRQLGAISPVVRTLAREQFDDYVKRVRIFIHPRVAESTRQLPDLNARLTDAVGS